MDYRMEFIYVCVRLQCDLRMQKQIKPMAAVPAVMMEEQYQSQLQ